MISKVSLWETWCRGAARSATRNAALWQQGGPQRVGQRAAAVCVGVLALAALFTPRVSAMAPAHTLIAFQDNAVAEVARQTWEVDAVEQTAASPAGLVIVATDADGPAAQAGIERGDILLQVGEVEIDAMATLFTAVAEAAPGEVVDVVVQHGDEVRTVEVTLAPSPHDPQRAYLGVQVFDAQEHPAHVAMMPVQVQRVEVVTVTETMADGATTAVTVTVQAADPASAPAAGLTVAEVLADSPAAQAGLRAGDLILALDGAPVAEPDALVSALSDLAPGDTVTLTVQRGGPTGAAIEEIPVTLGASPDDPDRAYLGIRFVALPPAINVYAMPHTEIMPATPAFPAVPHAAPDMAYPAMPYYVPGLPQHGMGFGYGACGGGHVTIEQHFYGMPPYVAMPGAASFGYATPYVLPFSAQSYYGSPAVPGLPVMTAPAVRVLSNTIQSAPAIGIPAGVSVEAVEESVVWH